MRSTLIRTIPDVEAIGLEMFVSVITAFTSFVYSGRSSWDPIGDTDRGSIGAGCCPPCWPNSAAVAFAFIEAFQDRNPSRSGLIPLTDRSQRSGLDWRRHIV